MEFNPGFDIRPQLETMSFEYGEGVFGPEVERRRLDDIRKSLRDKNADGPEIPYVVAMDVGKTSDRDDLLSRNLLYGAMIYSAGKIGDEPVRSQGHVHAISPSCGSSTPEVYEIWDGEAIIYMQETTNDNPGRCFAVHAQPGDVVVVPPAWAHYTVNANTSRPMLFGAWCVRDYGFDYTGVRSHGGLAWFPLVNDDGSLHWVPNDSYKTDGISQREARGFNEAGVSKGLPIYTQYEKDPELFSFVTRPEVIKDIWANYEP